MNSLVFVVYRSDL